MALTIVIALVFLLTLVVGHEFGHFVAAKLLGATVEEFGVGFPPKVASKKIGETEYSLNAIPFGGFVRIHGESELREETVVPLNTSKRSFRDLSAVRKVTIVAAGVLMNLLIAWAAFTIVFMIGMPQRAVISQVAAGSPAALANLSPGDQVLDFDTPEAFTSFIAANAGHEVSFKISHNGETKTLTVTPRVNPPAGEGHLGVAVIEGGVAKEGFVKAVIDGGKLTIEASKSIFATLAGLIKGILMGQLGKLSEVTGPVGIFGIIGQASKLGLVYLFELLGLISVNLAVVNSFPFPALDGGRILIIMLQKLNRRAVSPYLENIVNALGLIFLLFLMLLITIRDISRIL